MNDTRKVYFLIISSNECPGLKEEYYLKENTTFFTETWHLNAFTFKL